MDEDEGLLGYWTWSVISKGAGLQTFVILKVPLHFYVYNDSSPIPPPLDYLLTSLWATCFIESYVRIRFPLLPLPSPSLCLCFVC
jgi:hypothetical protein